MTVTIVEEACPVTCRAAVTGGVDTHADTHVAAALDPVGGLLGVAEFPATAAGYASLLGWLGGFGAVALVGIEGTGSYGAVEAIRALMVARRSAAGERTRTINQARALILTGPGDLRARFTRHSP